MTKMIDDNDDDIFTV